MHHIKVQDDFVSNLFESNGWSRFGINVKGQEAVEETAIVSESNEEGYEEIDESEVSYECPLCECELDGPLSEEVLSEHIDDVLTLVSESLNESDEIDEGSEDEDDYEEDDSEENLPLE